MNLSVFPSPTSKLLDRLGSLAFVRQPAEKENPEFKSIVPHLKIDLVSHPACGGGVGI